jgi:hypothetical protein
MARSADAAPPLSESVYSVSIALPEVQAQCAAFGDAKRIELLLATWWDTNRDLIAQGRSSVQSRLPPGHSIERYESLMGRSIKASFASLSPDKRSKRCASYLRSLPKLVG